MGFLCAVVEKHRLYRRRPLPDVGVPVQAYGLPVCCSTTARGAKRPTHQARDPPSGHSPSGRPAQRPTHPAADPPSDREHPAAYWFLFSVPLFRSSFAFLFSVPIFRSYFPFLFSALEHISSNKTKVTTPLLADTGFATVVRIAMICVRKQNGGWQPDFI